MSEQGRLWLAHNAFSDMDNLVKIEKIRKALNDGRLSSVEFYRDGSGASFYYYDSTGDHGCPCSMVSSLPMNDAVAAISGFRFAQSELNICF